TLDTEAKSIMFDETSDKTNNFLMIPQQLTAYDKNSHTDGAYIAVLCQISSKDGSSLTRLYPAEGDDAYAYSAVAINTKWEPGKKYIYTLTYGAGDGNGGGGIVPPNQGNPDPDNPVDPTEPQDPTPHNPGDPILDAPIKFTVEEVEVWSNQEEALSM
ncbi:fimbrillin family protein, partial [Bacteroides sp. KG68]